MRRRAAVTVGAIAAAGALAWGVPALALADDETSGDPSTGTTTPRDTERHEERRAELAQRLADELGIDVDKVEAALEKVGEEARAEHQAERLEMMQERLAQAVEDGRLTQEQADEMLAAAEDGEFPGRRGHSRGGRGAFGPGGHGGHGVGPGGSGSADPESGGGATNSALTAVFTA